ncbi:hypothetical protein HYFRA_00006520, partial [Hymenoscyphus fraxineus]
CSFCLTLAFPSPDPSNFAPADPTRFKICQEYNIPLNITAEIAVPTAEYTPFQNNLDVAAWLFNLARRDSKTAFIPLAGSKNVTQSYNISGTICSPLTPTNNQSTIILATHGLGFDRRYWDIRKNPANYSFVDSAISSGYSVFFYDRLGTGKSTKVSGYDGAHANIQLAILKQLSILLREGMYTGSLGKPAKLAHLGHSFGSFLSNALISDSPELSDAALLTGLGYDMSGIAPSMEALALRIANRQSKFKALDNEYLGAIDSPAFAQFFLHAGSYDIALLNLAFQLAQPLAAVEYLTLSTLPLSSPGFTGPVMVMDGENDFPLCGGNCVGTLGPAQTLYPNATDLQTVLHPNVGHGINYSLNATAAYNVLLDYLHKHGI